MLDHRPPPRRADGPSATARRPSTTETSPGGAAAGRRVKHEARRFIKRAPEEACIRAGVPSDVMTSEQHAAFLERMERARELAAAPRPKPEGAPMSAADEPDTLGVSIARVLAPVRTCGVHGTMLLHVEAEVTLRAGHDFLATLDRQVLPVLDRLRREAVPALGTAFAEWFVARLDGARDPGNWLDDVPLHAASAFCEALGVSVLHGPRTHPSAMGGDRHVEGDGHAR